MLLKYQDDLGKLLCRFAVAGVVTGNLHFNLRFDKS